jgi:hypothetical protein
MPADKPVIMGEYGAFIDRYADIDSAALNIQQWVGQSCELGFGGWLYWAHHPASFSVGDATWALTDLQSVVGLLEGDRGARPYTLIAPPMAPTWSAIIR